MGRGVRGLALEARAARIEATAAEGRVPGGSATFFQLTTLGIAELGRW